MSQVKIKQGGPLMPELPQQFIMMKPRRTGYVHANRHYEEFMRMMNDAEEFTRNFIRIQNGN